MQTGKSGGKRDQREPEGGRLEGGGDDLVGGHGQREQVAVGATRGPDRAKEGDLVGGDRQSAASGDRGNT